MRLRSDSASSSDLLTRFLAAVAVSAALSGLLVDTATAKVFYTQKEALEIAFPEATRLEKRTFIMSPEEVDTVESTARSSLDSRIAKFHVGWNGEEILGYAFIDVHTVRTLPEAFMVVIDPSGVVSSVRVLAFHEPLDYLPPDRWYQQFFGRSREDTLRLGGDIHGVVGATLSARAVTDSVRRVLALFQVLIVAEKQATVSPD